MYAHFVLSCHRCTHEFFFITLLILRRFCFGLAKFVCVSVVYGKLFSVFFLGFHFLYIYFSVLVAVTAALLYF